MLLSVSMSDKSWKSAYLSSTLDPHEINDDECAIKSICALACIPVGISIKKKRECESILNNKWSENLANSIRYR